MAPAGSRGRRAGAIQSGGDGLRRFLSAGQYIGQRRVVLGEDGQYGIASGLNQYHVTFLALGNDLFQFPPVQFFAGACAYAEQRGAHGADEFLAGLVIQR